MQTIKTAVVVVLLLFVLYGGYVALNGTDTPLREELRDLVKMDEMLPDVSTPSGPLSPPNSGESNGFSSYVNAPAAKFGANNSSPQPISSAPASSPFGAAFGLPSASSSPTTPSSTSGLRQAPLLAENPNGFPNPQPAAPANAAGIPAATTTPLPSLPSVSSLESKPQDANGSPAKNIESSVEEPISTSNPSFGLALPEPKIPAGFASTSSSSPNQVTPVASSVDLPSLHGGAKNLAEATTPKSQSDSEEKVDIEEPSLASTPKRPASAPGKSYQNAKELAMDQISRSNLKDALATLSVFYNAPEITSEQREDLLDLLDALSREVIFSRRHLLESAYIVAPGDTLEQVSKRYEIPTDIIARINAIEPESVLPNGASLKIVPGPFRAEVDLSRNELTLFLGDLYAGRFPVSIGNDPAPPVGVFQVIDKQRNRNYYGQGGAQFSANDPRNPYGGICLDLGKNITIHGSPESDEPASRLGCISLSPMDAADVFGILGRGSQVTIRQ